MISIFLSKVNNLINNNRIKNDKEKKVEERYMKDINQNVKYLFHNSTALLSKMRGTAKRDMRSESKQL